MKKIGIIGAGPSGLMAAISAKSKDNRVYVFDSNDEIGKKLRLTGGSRCNLTNAAFYDNFLDNIIHNKNFFYSAFNKFDNFALMEFFNKNGLGTKIEDDLRVFPKTDNSEDVINFFKAYLNKLNIKVKLNSKVDYVTKLEDKFRIKSSNKYYDLDYLIFATGGMTYPSTGSDGNAYKLAKSLGHKIVKLRPGLSPIYFKENLDARALSVKDIKLSYKSINNSFSLEGDLMINSNFLTGPLALKASLLINSEDDGEIYLDFFSKIKADEVDQLILKLIEKHPKKTIYNLLKLIMKEALAKVILKQSKISADTRVSELKKSDRKNIVYNAKEFRLSLDKLKGFDKAIITRGGIDVIDIDPTNLESRLVRGLFFVGEILDIDAFTGGFNLQISFSTGFAAGNFIKEQS